MSQESDHSTIEMQRFFSAPAMCRCNHIMLHHLLPCTPQLQCCFSALRPRYSLFSLFDDVLLLGKGGAQIGAVPRAVPFLMLSRIATFLWRMCGFEAFLKLKVVQCTLDLRPQRKCALWNAAVLVSSQRFCKRGPRYFQRLHLSWSHIPPGLCSGEIQKVQCGNAVSLSVYIDSEFVFLVIFFSPFVVNLKVWPTSLRG